MRRLIVNADDFGLTAGVNRAIVEAHEGGIVTSATLMANGQGFRRRGFTGEVPPATRRGLPHCPGGRYSAGSDCLAQSSRSRQKDSRKFRDSAQGIGKFAALAVLGRLDPDEIESEAKAQIRKLQASGNGSHSS